MSSNTKKTSISDAILDFVRDSDNISAKSTDRFHFDENKDTKTIIGGTCSLFIYLYILIFALNQGYMMLKRNNVFSESQE